MSLHDTLFNKMAGSGGPKAAILSKPDSMCAVISRHVGENRKVLGGRFNPDEWKAVVENGKKRGWISERL